MARWAKNEKNAIEPLACLLVATLLLAANVVAQDPPPNAKWRLTAIAFEGLIKPSQGLKVGQELKRDDQRLIVDVVVKYQR